MNKRFNLIKRLILFGHRQNVETEDQKRRRKTNEIIFFKCMKTCKFLKASNTMQLRQPV